MNLRELGIRVSGTNSQETKGLKLTRQGVPLFDIETKEVDDKRDWWLLRLSDATLRADADAQKAARQDENERTLTQEALAAEACCGTLGMFLDEFCPKSGFPIRGFSPIKRTGQK